MLRDFEKSDAGLAFYLEVLALTCETVAESWRLSAEMCLMGRQRQALPVPKRWIAISGGDEIGTQRRILEESTIVWYAFRVATGAMAVDSLVLKSDTRVCDCCTKSATCDFETHLQHC